MDAPQTLIEAVRYFSDLDLCEEYMRAMRWRSCAKSTNTRLGIEFGGCQTARADFRSRSVRPRI